MGALPVQSKASQGYDLLIDTLRDARVRAGVAQAALSERLGQSRMYVYKVETGRRRVDPEEVRLIAVALGLDPTEVFATWLSQVGT